MSDVAATALARLTAVPYAVRKALLERHAGAAGLCEAVSSRRAGTPEEETGFRLIEKHLDLRRAEEEVASLRKIGGWVLGYGSAGFPSLLSEIPDPPLALFGRGELPDKNRPHLGFVGPRKPSTYGARVARMLSEDLARNGVVLVSGLARGIDAIAHEAALKAGVPTVAVTGCGLDRTYPPEHAHLAEKVAACGAVVTEFGLGEPPRAEHFPQRNRIISGLSRGVLLVEAGERSGARITARHAAEQSRDVYAVPGPIDAPLSMETNRLISQGAKLVATSADVLEDLLPGFSREAPVGRETAANLSAEERRFVSRMERDRPRAAEELVEELGIPVGEVLRTLMELELKGWVVKQPDARYVRIAGGT